MSIPITVSSLPRISSASLSEILLAQANSNLDLQTPETDDKVAIVDVRDDDYIGGHIRTSLHVPSHTHSHAIPGLVQKLKTRKIVVFHCALSQQRGPRAALGYVRERERLVGKGTVELLGQSGGVTSVGEAMMKDKKEEIERRGKGVIKQDGADGGEGWEDVDREGEVVEQVEDEKQRVYILEGGFVGWEEKFGEDTRLTEGYRKEIWAEGY
ncbi:hypothetical protein HYALB_00009780 [Hymenoscyphus albidus]|uniref:Rhodanese domain-containing protein n=1 Tax=Hymenoscyphus albidus TaxID=595503 RepID=A0A9N9LSY2_9HELO|nr:hypothetical protein HYALB_00009780 [Hymenoscyphus albidus]